MSVGKTTAEPQSGSESGARTRTERARIAVVCGLSQWLLLLAIQVGDLLGYLLPPAAHNLVSYGAAGAALPLLQTQNLIVAAILGVIAYFASKYRVTGWAFFVLCLAVSLGLVLDQVYYKLFLDHFHLGMIEGGEQFNAVIIVGSFLKEADWIFCCSCVVAIAGSAWFARALWKPAQRPAPIGWIVGGAALVALLGIPKFSATTYGHVNEHPLLALVRELNRSSVADILGKRAPSANLKIRSLDPSVDREPRLAAIAAAAHSQSRRPNVVFIVMESVGAVDLLGPDGLPSGRITPNLARLAQKGIVFNSLYTTFPGTTRSLVSLHTGGRQMTSGYMNELQPEYTGPLLARYIGSGGYATALFSTERLDGEGTDIFLQKAGYQKYYDFSRDSPENHKKQELSSWGGREEYGLHLMENWIDQTPSGKPFYLEYMTVATHHPYPVPAGYRGPVKPGERSSDYRNALNYSDSVIGSLVDFLKSRDLLKNTIVAVTGDHGEAFGDLHANNFLHKNFIYDENVREFLLISDGRLADSKVMEEPVVSSRIGKNGDIMPTLMALAGQPVPDVPGRNLLEENFSHEPVYFHKMAPPEMMGLRDGRWKFINEIRSNRSELYDLSADPTEQTNLASAHPEMVSQYRDMARQWYLESEHEFTAFLKKSPSFRRVTPSTVADARTLAVGYWDRKAGPSSFIETSSLRAEQRAAVWTTWTGDADPGAIYEWTSPAGLLFFSRPLVTGVPHVTYSPFAGQDSMEPGKWSVQLRVRGGFRLTANFTVAGGQTRAKVPSNIARFNP